MDQLKRTYTEIGGEPKRMLVFFDLFNLQNL